MSLAICSYLQARLSLCACDLTCRSAVERFVLTQLRFSEKSARIGECGLVSRDTLLENSHGALDSRRRFVQSSFARSEALEQRRRFRNFAESAMMAAADAGKEIFVFAGFARCSRSAFLSDCRCAFGFLECAARAFRGLNRALARG